MRDSTRLAAIQTQRQAVAGDRGQLIRLTESGLPLTMSGVIEGWRTDAGFCDVFIAELAASPYAAFFWEMPPLQQQTVGDPFECAVIRSDALTRVRADASDFADQLSAATEGIAVFENLGG